MECRSGEVGCTTSHLTSYETLLENSDAPCALIMEDDCDIYSASLAIRMERFLLKNSI